MTWSPPVLVALLASALFSQGVAPIETGARKTGDIRAEACGACHADEYAQWRTSRHSQAWTNGLFRHDYERTPRQWCRNCHVPLALQQASLTAAGDSGFADEGVTCAACHVRNGRMHARARREGSPHDTVAQSDFGSPAFCAGCHQFNFPAFREDGSLSHYTDEPMQDTVAQFRRRAEQQGATGDCRGCHAADGAGHAYPGSHDPAMLRRALHLTVCRDERGAVVSTVENRGAGHNVPTGDVHRHLLVKVWRSTAPDGLRLGFFGRRFAINPTTGTKITTWDSTIAPGARRRFRVSPRRLGGEPGEPVNVELRYVYAANEYARVGEPTFTTVERHRLSVAELPACR